MNDHCLLCGHELPPRKLWQRLIGMQAPSCRAAGLSENECRARYKQRFFADLEEP